MIIQNRNRVGYSLVQACAGKVMPRTKRHAKLHQNIAIFLSLIAIILIGSLLKNKSGNAPQKTESEYHSVSSRYQIPMFIKDKKNQSTSLIDIEPQQNQKADLSDKIASPDKNSAAVSGDSSSPMPPFILGTLTITKQDKLKDIILLIHGFLTEEYMESLMTLNPHVTDPYNISAGTTVQLPAMAVATTDSDRNVYRIELANLKNLAEAKNALLIYKKKYPHIRMLAYWNKDKGLRFSICLENFFAQKEIAQKKCNALRPFLGKEAKIEKDWNGGTIFFSDLSTENSTRSR